MGIWRERLADVDDDYLIGLSNKGIVKRAYKDKAEITAQIHSMDQEASVEVGEETVTVCYPLGESKCTCPSRSMCRHVVQAILTLKERCLTEETAGAAVGEEPQPGEPPERNQGSGAGDQDKAGIPDSGDSGAAGTKEPAEQEEVSGQTGDSVHMTAVWQEITAYPFAKLKKILGVRQFQTFVNQAAAGIRPKIQSTSVVTVQLPRQDYAVKLLSPLEYSTCSCHKKEMCVHKAAAVLWCQLEAGTLAKESLLGELSETQEYDMDGVRAAASQMKTFLEELFATGLSRTSPDVLDYLERLAIISHNEGLARFEGYFRTLSDSYDRYFARKANFKTEDLMAQMARLYRRVELLLHAEETGTVGRLAGAFRADYLPAGNLDLIGIAMEHFESQAGYEGGNHGK